MPSIRAALSFIVLASLAGLAALHAWGAPQVTLPPTAPLSPGTFRLVEEFVNSATGGGQLGTHGWTSRSIGAAPTVAFRSGAAPNLGVLRLTTTTTGGQGGSLLLDNGSIGPLGNLAATAFDSYWVFAVPTTTSVRVRVGFSVGTGTGAVEPTDGVWLRYDTSAGYADTAFMCESRASSTSTGSVSSSGVAVNANFNTLRLRSSGAGTILCRVNGGAEIALSTNVPTAAMSPVALVVTDTTAARSLDLDYFGFEATGLAR